MKLTVYCQIVASMSNEPAVSSADETPARLAFYERISRQHMTPLWVSLANFVTPEPVSACQPAAWSFTDIRAAMMEAGDLITAAEAERRVLILENPGLRGQSKVTTDLYAGVQLVLPGEVAPAHRHSQTALRFVLEGSGAHTTVNGERTPMNYGDFIITPPMAWHEHGNETNQPVFWLDGLDIPIVQFLDASFAEHPDEDEQPIPRPVGESQARFGSNLLPIDHRPAGGRFSCVQLSICTHPRSPRTASPLKRLGSMSRAQDAVQQSPDGWISNVNDRGIYPASSQRIPNRRVSLDRCHHLCRCGRPGPHSHRSGFRGGVAATGHLRGSELEIRHAQSDR